MSISMKSNSSDKAAVSVSDILNVLYPVGSIYLTYNNNNPSNFLGGTWEQFGQGRTLIGVGSGTDTNSTAVEFKEDTSGGEYYHTLTTNEMPSHSHSISISGTTGANNRGHTHSYTHATSVQGHTLTIAEMPKHTHRQNVSALSGGPGLRRDYNDDGNGKAFDQGIDTLATGGGGSHSHGLNTSSATSGGESQNHTHTFSYTGNTGNNGSSNSHNNMQPYVTIYFWRRTE